MWVFQMFINYDSISVVRVDLLDFDESPNLQGPKVNF